MRRSCIADGYLRARHCTPTETERKANSIADLSNMQTEGANKMVAAVDEIAKVAEDNAASTEEVSAATEEQSAAMQEMAFAAKELELLSDELLQMVERFKIGTTAESAAIVAGEPDVATA